MRLHQTSAMRQRTISWIAVSALAAGLTGWCAEDLRALDPVSQQGVILTGRRLDEGPRTGMVNLVFLYSPDGVANRRQARAIATLYKQYQGRVHFVSIDLSKRTPAAQQALVRDYYRGMAPHVAILDKQGEPFYDRAGEAASHDLAKILDKELNR